MIEWSCLTCSLHYDRAGCFLPFSLEFPAELLGFGATASHGLIIPTFPIARFSRPTSSEDAPSLRRRVGYVPVAQMCSTFKLELGQNWAYAMKCTVGHNLAQFDGAIDLGRKLGCPEKCSDECVGRRRLEKSAVEFDFVFTSREDVRGE